MSWQNCSFIVSGRSDLFLYANELHFGQIIHYFGFEFLDFRKYLGHVEKETLYLTKVLHSKLYPSGFHTGEFFLCVCILLNYKIYKKISNS